VGILEQEHAPLGVDHLEDELDGGEEHVVELLGGRERLPHLEQDEEHLRLFGRLLADRFAADVPQREALGEGTGDVEAEALGDLVDVLDDLARASACGSASGRGRFGGPAVGDGLREGPRALLDVVDLGVAHPDDVAGVERLHLDPLAVDERAVGAAEVVDDEPVALPDDAGVLPGDEGVLELDVVLGRPADADSVLVQGDFPGLAALLDDEFRQLGSTRQT
jgi:hypothetical protein